MPDEQKYEEPHGGGTKTEKVQERQKLLLGFGFCCWPALV